MFADINCVVDRSGSMGLLRSDAIGGINTFIEEQKKVEGKACFSLALFNEEYTVIHAGVPLEDVKPLTEGDYVPAGMTALLDAIGKTIESVGKRLAALPKADRPDKVIFAILTDGLENSSTDFKEPGKIKEMIQHQTKKYGWEFFYLGANQDAIDVGTSMGVPLANNASYAATSAGTQGAYSTASSLVRSARGG